MAEILLRDKNIILNDTALESAFWKHYATFQNLKKETPHLAYDWKYYKDSKAWLCKVSYKKKTVFWLSVWEGFFKTSFFFLERHMEGITALDVDKNGFTIEKEWGKWFLLSSTFTAKSNFPTYWKWLNLKHL